ncbi:MAG: ribosome small subunit-dependent GTPase A, partial [Firmicutes bacterium]|nr:ribosome small subunit-dependent GTPase A [Bacillota bacterium]
LYLPDLKREDLIFYFREMEEYVPGCRFRGCLHRSEPDCAVKEAVAANRIDRGRDGRYRDILSEVIDKERRY